MYNRWKFTVLLTAILLAVVVHPVIWAGAVLPLLYYSFLALIYFGAILALYQRKKSRVAALVLGLPAIVGLVVTQSFPAAPPILLGIFFHLLPIVFLGYTVVTTLRTIFQHGDVTADSINGAFCGYLLLGVAFGHVYCLVDLFRPGSFTLQGQFSALPHEPDARHSLLTYFSLITLTTVGYGDITPTSPAARSLACIEAVAGQFYVAVVIAELIGLKLAAAMREPQPKPTELSRSGDDRERVL